MGQATITVKYKDAPKEGKKMWSISDGSQRFLVTPEEQDRFNIGGTYSLNYKTSQFNGRDFHTVVGAPKQPNGYAPPTNGNGAAKGLWLKLAVEQFDRPLGELWQRYKLAEEVWERGSASDLEDTF